MYRLTIALMVAINLLSLNCNGQNKYKANWESLGNYQAPEWYEDAKFGLWVHWGIYSLPGFAGDHAAEWYGRWMYAHEGQSKKNRGLATHQHHVETYGNPSEFGYKDFIPQFKAEKYNATEWVDIVKRGGAKFFCMMAVHHDSYCLWDSELTEWDAMEMGPKRDLVAEMEKAVRAEGLKFGVSNHSAWNYDFFRWNHVNKYDATDSQYKNLYGTQIIGDPAAAKGMPSERDLNRWLDRTKELCDKFKPDLYYFDWGMNHQSFASRRQEFASHYYNKALEWELGEYGKPNVVLNYKHKAFKTGTAIFDHERGGEPKIADMVWQTDDCVYDGANWGYVEGSPIKSANTIVDELVDVVSKRGVLMLSMAPKADGSFPQEQIDLIEDIGSWLSVCGEAIYATRPWFVFGEGTDKDKEDILKLTAEDIRFTRSKDHSTIYVFLMDWPKGKQIHIKSLNGQNIDASKIRKMSFVGSNQSLKYKQDSEGMMINLPRERPSYKYAYPIKIELNN